MFVQQDHLSGASMKIRPLFAWYDMWIGAYYDRKDKKLYVLPLPCLGIVIDFKRPPKPLTEDQKKEIEALRKLGYDHGVKSKPQMWHGGSYTEGYTEGARWVHRYESGFE